MTTSVNTVLEIIPHHRRRDPRREHLGDGAIIRRAGAPLPLRWHEEDRSLLERWHEFAADPRPWHACGNERYDASHDHWFAVGEDTLITGRSETASERAARARSRGAV